MPTIWRVENSKRQGCYCAIDENQEYANDWFNHSLSCHCSGNGHPSPMMDKGIERNPIPKEICAFKTKSQAKQWFNKEELNWLKERGFYLKKLKVDKITAIGEKQILAICP